MTDRPIIFSGPMVRALLDGTKTQTRRIIKPQPDPDGLAREIAGGWFDTSGRKYPLAEPGDRLYVRETHWRLGRWMNNGLSETGCQKWTFKASHDPTAAMFQEPQVAFKGRARGEGTERWWKRPAIFMSRPISRLTLEVTGVKVERLQEISEEDARAEGMESRKAGQFGPAAHIKTYRTGFVYLWNSLNAKRDGGIYAWADNPWVIAITFTVHQANIDSMDDEGECQECTMLQDKGMAPRCIQHLEER